MLCLPATLHQAISPHLIFIKEKEQPKKIVCLFSSFLCIAPKRRLDQLSGHFSPHRADEQLSFTDKLWL